MSVRVRDRGCDCIAVGFFIFLGRLGFKGLKVGWGVCVEGVIRKYKCRYLGNIIGFRDRYSFMNIYFRVLMWICV